MNENDVIDRMARLLMLSEPNEDGFTVHGNWSQYRDSYFKLFDEMCAAGLDLNEDIIIDRLGMAELGPGALKRWEQDVMTAWNEWRYAWSQFKRKPR